ncbi:hypothetical protein NLG97_g1787 [Lecanicillium saksenae]|uniref:Uncharacterized protein n=1 Tax=Lecanicillium saksenae TaxID=468837 RepID=A0ACC1R3F7_9HYPO|nr:hypothetical protein NLG97_g1787 [Lecanicillium saksenae]
MPPRVYSCDALLVRALSTDDARVTSSSSAVVLPISPARPGRGITLLVRACGRAREHQTRLRQGERDISERHPPKNNHFFLQISKQKEGEETTDPSRPVPFYSTAYTKRTTGDAYIRLVTEAAASHNSLGFALKERKHTHIHTSAQLTTSRKPHSDKATHPCQRKREPEEKNQNATSASADGSLLVPVALIRQLDNEPWSVFTCASACRDNGIN